MRQFALLVLGFAFDILDGVTGLDLKGDGLCKGLHLYPCHKAASTRPLAHLVEEKEESSMF